MVKRDGRRIEAVGKEEEAVIGDIACGCVYVSMCWEGEGRVVKCALVFVLTCQLPAVLFCILTGTKFLPTGLVVILNLSIQ